MVAPTASMGRSGGGVNHPRAASVPGVGTIGLDLAKKVS
jgi:hypothetical protein